MAAKKRTAAVKSREREYGAAHRRLRRQWAAEVESGGVACRRCGQLIAPGALWDLGHSEVDRTIPPTPEHRYCNRAAPGRRRRRVPVSHAALLSPKSDEAKGS